MRKRHRVRGAAGGPSDPSIEGRAHRASLAYSAIALQIKGYVVTD